MEERESQEQCEPFVKCDIIETKDTAAMLKNVFDQRGKWEHAELSYAN